MGQYSQERIESRIITSLNTLIVSREIKHPKLSTFVTATRVEVSKDNAYAKVFVSSLMDDGTLESSIKALQQSAHFIQSRLAKVLKTRNTPKLTFYPDNSRKEAFEINKVLSEIEHE